MFRVTDKEFELAPVTISRLKELKELKLYDIDEPEKVAETMKLMFTDEVLALKVANIVLKDFSVKDANEIDVAELNGALNNFFLKLVPHLKERT